MEQTQRERPNVKGHQMNLAVNLGGNNRPIVRVVRAGPNVDAPWEVLLGNTMLWQFPTRADAERMAATLR
jgi:hypothetical protein